MNENSSNLTVFKTSITLETNFMKNVMLTDIIQPFYQPTANNHVRKDLKTSTYILIESSLGEIVYKNSWCVLRVNNHDN